jgi:hypothetical protein
MVDGIVAPAMRKSNQAFLPSFAPRCNTSVAERENPFRSECVEALEFRPQGEDWPEILGRLREMSYRGAIVGPKGHGKTTMLEELGRRLEAEGWRMVLIRLNEEMPRMTGEVLVSIVRTADLRTIVLIDGAEQLRAPAWLGLRWYLRHAGGLVITIHRPGRLPTLHECRTSPALLQGLIDELFNETPGKMLERQIREDDYKDLYRECAGDLRRALMALYRRHAGVETERVGGWD